MNNIFENAYFGKTYKTKDNTIVRFIVQYCDDFIILYIPKSKYSIETTHRYNSKGEFYLGDGEFGHGALDIVSEWEEEIDEKVLQTLEIKYFTEDVENGVMENDLKRWYPNDEQSWIQGYNIGFDRGYKAAKKGE